MARRDARFFILSSGRPGDALDEDAFYQSGREFVGSLLAAAESHPTNTALEIGCGLGRNVFALAAHFDRAVGLDISDEMVRGLNDSPQCPDNAEARLIGPDARFPDVADGSADFILSAICLQHVSAWNVIERTMHEIGRVLSPAGLAMIQFDTRDNPLARRLYMTLPDLVLPAVHRRGMRRVPRPAEDVRALASSAGLRIEAERGERTAEHWLHLRRAR